MIDLSHGTTAETSRTPFPILELRASSNGTLSIARVDACRFHIESSGGPLHWSRKVKLQGSELFDTGFRKGDLVYRHRVKQALYRWSSGPEVSQRIVCD